MKQAATSQSVTGQKNTLTASGSTATSYGELELEPVVAEHQQRSRGLADCQSRRSSRTSSGCTRSVGTQRVVSEQKVVLAKILCCLMANMGRVH